MHDKVFKHLDTIKFPNCNKRPLVSKGRVFKTMTFGITGLANWNFESVKNKKHPETYELLKEYAKFLDESHEYTSITINKNFKSFPHYDSNNIGTSMIIGVGDYDHGELSLQDVGTFDIKNKQLYFDGAKTKHWTEDFTGTRYSIIYFKRKTNKNLSDI